MTRPRFYLGSWTIDPATNSMSNSETEVQLEPRLMKLLLLLAERAGFVVSKDEMAAQVWEDQYVTSETVSVAIYELRKALGDSARAPTYIKTIRKMGFQLLAQVSEVIAPETVAPVGIMPEAVMPEAVTAEIITARPAETVSPGVVEPSGEPEQEEDTDEVQAAAPAVESVPEVPALAPLVEPKTEEAQQSQESALEPIPRVPVRWPTRWMWVTVGLCILLLTLYLWWWTPPQPDGAAALAVLPLAFMSGDPEQAYFAEGMTEALITDLARVTALRVLPRRSVLPYAHSDVGAREIGTQLGVDFLLEGGVQVLDGQVVVTLQIVEARGERHLWTQTYRKPIMEFFQIQAQASQDLMHYFRGDEQVPASLGYEQQLDAVAFHAYLKGRHLLNSELSSDIEKSIPYFRRVLKSAPDFAPAHASLATCYVFHGELFPQLSREQARALAEEHLQKGLALDGAIAELHLAHGVALFRDGWLWSEAEQAFLRALLLHPTNPETHRWYAFLLAATGRGDAAVERALKAVALAPKSADIRFSLGQIFALSGRVDEAILHLQAFLVTYPEHAKGQLLLFLLQHRDEHVDDFFASFRAWLVSLDEALSTDNALREIRSRQFLSPETRAGLLQRYQLSERLSPLTLARLSLLEGQREDALVWLHTALESGDPELPFLGVDPLFSGLQEDVRFLSIVTEMGLRPLNK